MRDARAAATADCASAGPAYIDTSALAKWYLPEPGSEEVEEFIGSRAPVGISLLTKVEMYSLVARRCRQGDLDAEAKGKVLATFEGDIVAGHLQLVPHTVEAFLAAGTLLGAYPEIALTTLDALHLATMVACGLVILATADIVMAQTAEKMGIACVMFPNRSPEGAD